MNEIPAPFSLIYFSEKKGGSFRKKKTFVSKYIVGKLETRI